MQLEDNYSIYDYVKSQETLSDKEKELIFRIFPTLVSRNRSVTGINDHNSFMLSMNNLAYDEKRKNNSYVISGKLHKENYLSALLLINPQDEFFFIVDKDIIHIVDKWFMNEYSRTAEYCNGIYLLTNIDITPLVSYVIPTVGRNSILHTLKSIELQDTGKFLPTYCIPDSSSNRRPNDESNAGLTRNRALDLIDRGWVGFVDDDDILVPGCLRQFYQYMSDYDVLIPKAKFPSGHALWSTTDIIGGNVGIWFYYNKDKFPHVRFSQGGYEDFRFLVHLKNMGARIKFIDQVSYIVQPTKSELEEYNLI